jgi:hypothetical protein
VDWEMGFNRRLEIRQIANEINVSCSSSIKVASYSFDSFSDVSVPVSGMVFLFV